MHIVPHTFKNCLDGLLGEYWKNDAERQIKKAKEDLESGKITINSNGVAYNCIGRVLMNDMAEIVSYVTDKINIKATKEARLKELDAATKEYIESRKNLSEEQKREHYLEMKAAFGPGTYVDVISGEKIVIH